jgi:hypothetical protein
VTTNPLNSRNPIRLNRHAAGLGAVDWLRHHFAQLGMLAANPIAFFIVCAYGLLWFPFERETSTGTLSPPRRPG